MLAPWAETIDAPHTATTVRLLASSSVRAPTLLPTENMRLSSPETWPGHAQGRGNDIAISVDDMGAAQRRRNDEVVVPAVDVGAEQGAGAGISSESDVALAGAVGVGP